DKDHEAGEPGEMEDANPQLETEQIEESMRLRLHARTSLRFWGKWRARRCATRRLRQGVQCSCQRRSAQTQGNDFRCFCKNRSLPKASANQGFAQIVSERTGRLTNCWSSGRCVGGGPARDILQNRRFYSRFRTHYRHRGHGMSIACK